MFTLVQIVKFKMSDSEYTNTTNTNKVQVTL